MKGTSTCLSSDEDWDETSLGFMHDTAGKFGLFTFFPGKKIRKNEQFYKQTKFILGWYCRKRAIQSTSAWDCQLASQRKELFDMMQARVKPDRRLF